MKTNVKILLWGCATVLLFSMLSFPLGFDQAIFEVGGAMIAKNGAIPFRDFIELKQPLLFYVYSLSTLFFGRHEWSIRLLDVGYHLLSLLLLFNIIRSVYNENRFAYTYVFSYIVFYVGTGFWMTAEAESFALLPQIAICWTIVQLDVKQTSIRLIAMMVAGSVLILLFLKITLVIVAAAIPVFLLLTSDGEDFKRKRDLLLWSSIFIIIGGATIIGILIAAGAFENIMLSFDWLNHYASFYPLLGLSTFKDFYTKTFLSQFMSTVSPAFVILGVAGLILSPIRIYSGVSGKKDRFKLFCFIAFIMSMLSVLVERKGFNYHYTRTAIFFLFFVAEAIIIARTKISQNRKAIRESGKKSRQWIFESLTGIGLITIVIFSPIPRLIDQSIVTPLTSFSEDVSDSKDLAAPPIYYTNEMKEISHRYSSGLLQEDNIFVWGNSAGLYYYFNRLPSTISIVNVLFSESRSPEQWRARLIDQLYARPPKLFICEYRDERPLITGVTTDSYAELLAFGRLKRFVVESYRLIDSTSHFKIYLHL